MGIEIERKYVVKDPSAAMASWAKDNGRQQYITQGYLTNNPECVVRVRHIYSPDTQSESGKITIKGAGSLSRQEFEYIIPADHALEMLKLAAYTVTKFRYETGPNLVIDQFVSVPGMWLAEIELQSEHDEVVLPDYVGDEVTGKYGYDNLTIAQKGKPIGYETDVFLSGRKIVP